jgi:hypothetical protein
MTTCEACEQFFGTGNFTEVMASAPLVGAVIALGFIILFLILAVFYIYTSFAWMDIAKKLKYKHSWLAWIPIARWAMILQLGKFHWAFVFLALIPFLGWIALWVLLLVATWRIFEKRKYPGWLALIPILGFLPAIGWLAHIAFLIILGFVAWKKR